MLKYDEMLVVTIHVEDDSRSNYIKLSIENSGDEIVKLVRTISEVKLVRFYDYMQDRCLFEWRKDGFKILEPSYVEVITKGLKKFAHSKEKEIIQYVDIYNFWMDEKYNNLTEIKKIVEQADLKIYTQCWIDKTN